MLGIRSKKIVVQGQVEKIRLANLAVYFDSIGITPRSMSELTRLIVNTTEKAVLKQEKFEPVTSTEEADHILAQIIRDKSSMDDNWIGEL